MRRARGCASRTLLILTRYSTPIITCRVFVLLSKSVGDSFHAPTEPSQKHFFLHFFFAKICIYKKKVVILHRILKNI